MMNEFVKLSLRERNAIISNTSEKKKLSQAIIEKDFWVTWVLYYLFNQFKYKDFICFKGGTCLSKVYHIINRFSEDIDLSMDWALLGIDEDTAYENRTNRQQDIFNKSVNEKTEKYIKQIILPLLIQDFSKLLNEDFEVFVDELDNQTICFKYPQSFTDTVILQVIRLEFGVLAEPVPSNYKEIKNYVSEAYPNLFKETLIYVKAVDIQRTFFEKITILHREAYRVNGNYPMRYSRHFYDLYQMINQNIGIEALEHLDILGKVVYFKKKFYPCKWAMYDSVLEGKCNLIPSDQVIKVFSKDYEEMKGMIYGVYPSFEEIITTLTNYESILNEKVVKEIKSSRKIESRGL